MYSKAAEELMVLTCAAESDGGTYFKQVKGPALGIYMMEPATHEDVWNTVLSRRIDVLYKILAAGKFAFKPAADLLTTNPLYATYLARVYYSRFKEPLPDADDVKGLAAYYKKYWATEASKASVSSAVEKYNRFTGRLLKKTPTPVKKKTIASKASV